MFFPRDPVPRLRFLALSIFSFSREKNEIACIDTSGGNYEKLIFVRRRGSTRGRRTVSNRLSAHIEASARATEVWWQASVLARECRDDSQEAWRRVEFRSDEEGPMI
jgi:hypothetical protein